jgi:hypothetical protein
MFYTTRGQVRVTIMDIIDDGTADIFTINLFCLDTVALMNSVYNVTSLLRELMVSFRDLNFFFPKFEHVLCIDNTIRVSTNIPILQSSNAQVEWANCEICWYVSLSRLLLISLYFFCCAQYLLDFCVKKFPNLTNYCVLEYWMCHDTTFFLLKYSHNIKKMELMVYLYAGRQSYYVTEILYETNFTDQRLNCRDSPKNLCMIQKKSILYIYIFFFCCGTVTQRGSWPPHSWDF